MSAKRFIDTNVFVYCFEESEPAKQKKAKSIVRHALVSGEGVISFQVVQEFLNVATRRFAKPMTASEASLYQNQVLMPLCHVFPSRELYEQALVIKERYELGFYDSLMLSAALENDCRKLLSEDLQAG